MDDQTRIMDEGTAIYPLDPELAMATEPCPHCSEQIPVGDQFCPKCGYQRDTWAEGADDAGPDAAAPVTDARFALRLGDELHPLPDGETVAGRSADADITIADGYISRRHARFVVDGASVKVYDLGSANGSFLGEEKLNADEEHELNVGTVIKLGQSELILEAVEPAEETEPAPEGEETMVAPPEDAPAEEGAGEPVSGDLDPVGMLSEAVASPWELKRLEGDEVISLTHGAVELGRKAGKCDVVVAGDGYISGKHAKLVVSLEHLEVIDLGSTNGTYVNNVRLVADEVVELTVGDTLRLGQTDLEVVFTEPADEPAKPDAPVEETAPEPDPEAGEPDQ